MLPEAQRFFTFGTQARRIYDLLACGPATGDQIARQTKITGYQKQIALIRKRISSTGVTVKARPLNGRRNRWEYRLGVTEIDPERP
jgi:hypothetical protein